MKKLILVLITIGLFAVSGCQGTKSANSGVSLKGKEFAPVSE